MHLGLTNKDDVTTSLHCYRNAGSVLERYLTLVSYPTSEDFDEDHVSIPKDVIIFTVSNLFGQSFLLVR